LNGQKTKIKFGTPLLYLMIRKWKYCIGQNLIGFLIAFKINWGNQEVPKQKKSGATQNGKGEI
jgi:hypothetical protein